LYLPLLLALCGLISQSDAWQLRRGQGKQRSKVAMRHESLLFARSKVKNRHGSKLRASQDRGRAQDSLLG
jgi:hypothetical protein